MKKNWWITFGAAAMSVPLGLGLLGNVVNADETSKKEGDVVINETNFPDEVFRKWVSEEADTSKDGVLSESEIGEVKIFEQNGKDISDLKGIEYFTSLWSLSCTQNKLAKLELGERDALKVLMCCDNQLTELDVSGCKNLEVVVCYGNKIAELDIGNCPSLTNVVQKSERFEVDSAYAYNPVDPDNNAYGSYALAYDKTTKIKGVPVAKTQETGVAGFIDRLYQIALERDPEKEGKDYWVGEIEDGSKTGGDCAHFFLIDAKEFMNRGLSNDDFVETLYACFFDRESEPKGKEYWVGELNNKTKTKEDVINGFIDSTEWCNVCASYGVRSGAGSAKAEIASKNATEFATRLYTKCLGRDPEEKGLAYWSLALTNLEKNGSEAAQLFFESEEFVNLDTTDKEYVARLYKTFMGRDPEEDGWNYWVGELENGKSRLEVMAGFAKSDEFTNICKSYSIERGTIEVPEPKKVPDREYTKEEIVNSIYNFYLKQYGSNEGLVIFDAQIKKTETGYAMPLRTAKDPKYANRLVTDITVNLTTGEVKNSIGDEWNFMDYLVEEQKEEPYTKEQLVQSILNYYLKVEGSNDGLVIFEEQITKTATGYEMPVRTTKDPNVANKWVADITINTTTGVATNSFGDQWNIKDYLEVKEETEYTQKQIVDSIMKYYKEQLGSNEGLVIFDTQIEKTETGYEMVLRTNMDPNTANKYIADITVNTKTGETSDSNGNSWNFKNYI